MDREPMELSAPFVAPSSDAETKTAGIGTTGLALGTVGMKDFFLANATAGGEAIIAFADGRDAGDAATARFDA